ncbi:PREDICTED: uncharacterized protein LOC104810075 [Tarenaya hassleriana]|uniref:uncharacterized protein LOC104810075 n=1 Tax=Tarenaya hassleriana TaxID=28532 RepID=UPI00053C5A57|nr:PREDICTED: uncharacterized protein LOC104810075 [Tarenaya hassleriana]
MTERQQQQKLQQQQQQLLLRQNPPEGTTYLVVNIFRTAGVSDGAPAYPSGGRNLYTTLVWIDPMRQYKTSTAKTFGDPAFDERVFIPVESPLKNLNLNLELVRGMSWRDPGTSDGITVVGRAKIPLPENLGSAGEISKVAKLFRMENGTVVPKGFIGLSFALVVLDTLHAF